MRTVAIVAAVPCGILEKTGTFADLINPLTRRSNPTGSPITSTIFATFRVWFSGGAQFLAIILAARGYLEPYRAMNLFPLNLSKAVEAAGESLWRSSYHDRGFFRRSLGIDLSRRFVTEPSAVFLNLHDRRNLSLRVLRRSCEPGEVMGP